MVESELLPVLLSFAKRATEPFDVELMLRELAVSAAEVLPVAGAGVAYWTGTAMEFVYGSSAPVVDAERAQSTLQQGPCQDALRTGHAVTFPSLALEVDRWPAFVDRALSLGLRSAAAVPLLARGQVWGSLDLYRGEVGPVPTEMLVTAQVLADIAVSYVVLASDRGHARLAHDRSEHAATHDQLTGLPNRALLYDRLEHAVHTAKRRGSPLAVLFLDLDDFKPINDTLGHEIGDLVLKETAARLTGTLRAGDTLARLGGDEFVIICEDLTPGPAGSVSTGALSALTQRVRAAFTEPAVLAGHTLTLTASLGVATATAGIESPDALLRAADTAMYAAKRQARQAKAQEDTPPGRGNVINLTDRTAAPQRRPHPSGGSA